MSVLSKEALESELRLHPQPIGELKDGEAWIHVGSVTLSKHHATFSVGWAHPLLAETRFVLEPFDVDGKRGIAVVLLSGGKPSEYFAGWVPPEEEPKAVEWVSRLNREIQQRLATKVASDVAETVDVLTYDQGHEYAPDAPWGGEKLRLTRAGELHYERRRAGKVLQSATGRVDPAHFRRLIEVLNRTSFPTPPQATFPPGASVCTIATAPPLRRMPIEYYAGLRMPDYGDMLKELFALCGALRENKQTELSTWAFTPSFKETQQ